MPVEEDGLYGAGFVSQNLGPVRHEGIPVRWVLGRESRHLVRVRVQLLLEEDRQVTHPYVPQENIGGLGVGYSCFHGVVLSSLAKPPDVSSAVRRHCSIDVLVYHISLSNLFSLPISPILWLLNYGKQALSPRSGHEPNTAGIYRYWVRCPHRRSFMTPLRCLRRALSMTQGSRWHDNLDQPRRHVIDESGNQPVVRQGGDRLEGSHIDRHRRVRIGDRFGQEAFFADTKVARQNVGLPFEVSNPALGVLKNDQMKAPRRASSPLGYPPQHPHGLQRRGSDAPTNIAYHDSLSELEAKQVSRIDARINTDNDHAPQGRHHGQILEEMMGSEVLITFYQCVKRCHSASPSTICSV